MSNAPNPVFLFDPNLTGETTGKYSNFVPTTFGSSLGIGQLATKTGNLVFHAMANVRGATVTRGTHDDNNDPQTGLVFDGGITIIDSTGSQGTMAERIWYFNEGEFDSAAHPDKLLENLILGGSDISYRIGLIIAGYKCQENDRSNSHLNDLIVARGATRSAIGRFYGITKM